VTPDDQLVEVDGLLRGEAMEPEVVEDEQVGRQEATEDPLGGVVDAGLRHLAEVVVGRGEADAASGADGRVAERLGQEALADADGADEQDVLAAVEELQGEGGVEQAAVEAYGGGPVEVLEAAELLEAGLAQPKLEAPVVAAAHLVDEEELEEVGVVELVAASEGDALGQGVEHATELESLEQRAELCGGGGHRGAPVGVCVRDWAKTEPERAKRPGGGGSSGVSGVLS